ncbi:MFS transporter [Lactiplantibacillus pentosus]|uniref:MFS transporter n=1 Tax=Lactiplantibacillus pentosus TaxID=1589 RepID=UPI00067DE999|nr:MFS transporter [Lactiplantibacillus pentosus]
MQQTRSFKQLWSSFLISEMGDWLLKIALPLAIYNQTGSATQMATVYGISFLPWIFFSLFDGIMADRYNKKLILILGNLVSGILVLILAILLSTETTQIGLIYLIVFFQSSVDPLIHPSFQSILPSIVKDNQIVAANTSIQLVDNTLNLLGPLVGGSLAVILNPNLSIVIDAVSFLIAGLLLTLISYQHIETAVKHHTIFNDIKTGFHYSYQNKIVWNGALLFLCTNFATNMFEANFMYFITGTLKYSALFAGITMAISGIGAVLGGLIAPILNNHYSSGKIITSTTILAGLGLVAMFQATNFIYIGIAYGVSNLCSNINVITYFSLRQRVVPEVILGRVVSVTRMISYIAMPLGSFFGGYLIGHHISLYVIILIAGILRTLVGLYARSTPLGRSNGEESVVSIEAEKV